MKLIAKLLFACLLVLGGILASPYIQNYKIPCEYLNMVVDCYVERC